MSEVTWAVAGPPLLEEAAVERAIQAAADLGGRPGLELAVTFVSEAELTRMHGEYLDDPTATDVITFDLGAGDGPAGELYVSVERAREVAGRRSVSVERELTLYVVHGVLHLCGFDDHEARATARMRSAEAAAMAALGFPDDPADHELGTRVD
jgi:probable rRNA maturation factor